MTQAERPSEAPLNVALIGVGMVAKTHLRAVRDLAPLVRLRGVLATTPERAQAFADTAAREEGVGDVVAYADLEALIADEALDFVIVLTPPNARQAIVEALCAARLPILMEKPVERDWPGQRRWSRPASGPGTRWALCSSTASVRSQNNSLRCCKTARWARWGWSKSACPGGVSRLTTTNRGGGLSPVTAAVC